MLPPYRIRTERLTLRCLDPMDAEILGIVTAKNEEHLSPWMPWAHDLPRPLESMVKHLERLRAEFDRGRDFNFGIWAPAEDVLVGCLGMHARGGRGELEIGYWIVADRTGRGYASEAVGAATRVAIELLGAERIEIHVQPENLKSLQVPTRLGFRRVALARNRLQWRDGSWRDQVIWALRADELAHCPVGEVPYQTFDSAGRLTHAAGRTVERMAQTGP